MASVATVDGNRDKIHTGKRTLLMSGAILRARYGGTITIGDNCVIYRGVIIDPGTKDGSVVIGDRCSVNPYSVLYGHGGLKIGNDVLIAAHVVIIPANHGIEIGSTIRDQPIDSNGITIGNDIWIGANVTILDGVTIGDGAVIGAGSVVTKDITPYSVNVGSPARMTRMRK